MRLLADVASLAAHPRLVAALQGLERRGHAVHWCSGPAAAVRRPADLALGGAEAPGRLALEAWLAGARASLLDLGAAPAARWSPIQRWSFEASAGALLAEPGGAGAAARNDEREDGWAAWSGEPIPDAARAAHPDVEMLERRCERVLARRRARSPRAAAFVDRDGTLIVEKNYVGRPEDVELLPGAAAALRQLAAAGYALVVVSNQSGVARGYYTLEDAHATMGRLRVLLRREGVELDAVYFCPHHPDQGCTCRKPGTALFEAAAANLNLALRQSVVIGDQRTDLEAARRVRARGVLVRSGHGRVAEASVEPGAEPVVVAEDVLDAARRIVAEPPAD